VEQANDGHCLIVDPVKDHVLFDRFGAHFGRDVVSLLADEEIPGQFFDCTRQEAGVDVSLALSPYLAGVTQDGPQILSGLGGVVESTAGRHR
jgi:hypothetical protein